MPTATRGLAQAYGDDPEVLARVLEYCGATASGAPSAASVATLRDTEEPCATWGTARRHPASAIARLLHDGGDLARSLWDTRHLVLLVDVDHQNPQIVRRANASSPIPVTVNGTVVGQGMHGRE